MTAGFARMDARVDGGFARVDRWFELQQQQFLEFRAEMLAELARIHARIDALTERVDRLEKELRAFRDWATREVADLRRAVRTLDDNMHEARAETRRELDRVNGRVDRLEHRLDEFQT
jgi:polyhydroxyalkanoate synthesis regulator phasin